MNLLQNFFKVIYSKNIVVISSTLQLINLVEFIFANKDIKKSFSNYLIICPYTDKSVFEKLKNIDSKFIKKKNVYLLFNKSYLIKVLYLILYLRKFCNINIENLILGNYFTYVNDVILKISKKVYILDDGTNFLDPDHKNKTKNSKDFFFSFYERSFFPKGKYQKNNFSFLKNKYKTQKKYSNNILVLGKPFVELGYLNDYQYDLILENLPKIFKSKSFIYYPHPREEPDRIKKFKFLKVLKPKIPIEIYILEMNKYPKNIISFCSSAAIPLKNFNKKLLINNIYITFKKGVMKEVWKNFYAREKEIAKYFKKFSIKTKKIRLNY